MLSVISAILHFYFLHYLFCMQLLSLKHDFYVLFLFSKIKFDRSQGGAVVRMEYCKIIQLIARSSILNCSALTQLSILLSSHCWR